MNLSREQRQQSLQALIDQDPSNVEAHIALADLYFEEKSTWNLALEKYEHALLIDDKNSDARIGKVLCLHWQEKYREAVDLLEETAKNVSGKILWPYLIRSEKYFILQEYIPEDHLEFLHDDPQRVAKHNPYDTTHLGRRASDAVPFHLQHYVELLDLTVETILAIAYSEMKIGDDLEGQNEEEYEDDELEEDDLKHYYITTAYYSRANVWKEFEDYERAFADYNNMLRYDPEDTLAFVGRASVYREQEQYDLAIAEYTKCIEIEKQSPSDATFYLRASIYQTQGNLDLALEDINRAIEISKQKVQQGEEEQEDPMNYESRAEFYKQLGNDDLALADYEHVWNLNVSALDTELALRDYLLLLHKLNNQDKLDQLLTEVMERYPERDARLERGTFFCEAEKPEQALEDFNWILKHNPEDDSAYVWRARVHYQLKQFDQAEQDAAKAIELDPSTTREDIFEDLEGFEEEKA